MGKNTLGLTKSLTPRKFKNQKSKSKDNSNSVHRMAKSFTLKAITHKRIQLTLLKMKVY